MSRPKITYLERGKPLSPAPLVIQLDRAEDATLPRALRPIVENARGMYFDPAPPRQDLVATLKRLSIASDEQIGKEQAVFDLPLQAELVRGAYRLWGGVGGREKLVRQAGEILGDRRALSDAAIAGERAFSAEEERRYGALRMQYLKLKAELEINPQEWSADRVRRAAAAAIAHVPRSAKPRTLAKDTALVERLRILTHPARRIRGRWQLAGKRSSADPELRDWIDAQAFGSFTAFAQAVFARFGRKIAQSRIRALEAWHPLKGR